MSELRIALDEYLAMRRALGYDLRSSGTCLRDFVLFLDLEGAPFITTELALRWAKRPAEAEPSYWAGRLGMARRFARYRSAADPRTEIPPDGLLPHRYRRKAPYIYSEAEISKLVEAAKGLRSPRGLRAHTCSTLLGLLAVTGMRVSEPVALDCDDVDLAAGVLTVRRTKFGKSRLVPVHPSTRRVLEQYADRRDRICPRPESPAFFISERGTRMTDCAVRWTFVQLSRQIGLRSPSDRKGPRLHDLRHRLAVRTLIHWYRGGVDVERHLPELAAYLGHVHITDTYWYLSATPELLRLASGRLEHPQGGRP